MNNIDTVIEKGKTLADMLNGSMFDFVKNYTDSVDTINNHKFKIDFEKLFSKLFLSDAKKKQVGYLSYYKGKKLNPERLSITGFESVKSDTPKFFQTKLELLYEQILNNFNDISKIREFIKQVAIDLKKADIEDIIIYKKMSKAMKDYDGTPIHIRALKNVNELDLRKGDNVNMLFVKDKREVIHYTPGMNIDFEIDYKKYFIKFMKDKINYLDENIHFKLFEEKNKLLDKSKLNLNKKKLKRKSKSNPLI